MLQSVCALRKAAVALVAACSVIGALILVWQVNREQVGLLSNGHLLGMLALFLLPGGTLAAWELDRRSALRALNRAARNDREISDNLAPSSSSTSSFPTPRPSREDRPAALHDPVARPLQHRHRYGAQRAAAER
jgi:hypothetical protein